MTKEEFGGRVTAMQGRLYRIARGYLQSEHDCLDAVSEAILKAWQKRGSLRAEGQFEGWLIRILIRECVNIQRRQKRVVPVESFAETAQPAENTALRDALDELPQDQRIVVLMHYMEGYSVAEIADILHTFRGTVASRLHYARLRLRDILKEEET